MKERAELNIYGKGQKNFDLVKNFRIFTFGTHCKGHRSRRKKIITSKRRKSVVGRE